MTVLLFYEILDKNKFSVYCIYICLGSHQITFFMMEHILPKSESKVGSDLGHPTQMPLIIS